MNKHPWIHKVLDEPTWLAMAQVCRDRHAERLAKQTERRSHGRPDPSVDFLFEYYKLRPSRFLRYSPGFGVMLQGSAAHSFLSDARYAQCEQGIYLRPEALPRHRREGLTWIRHLLQKTLDRPAHFRCHGLHEWALVHGSELRHPGFELRVSRDAIASHLEGAGFNCTHYEACRFFAPEALKLNTLQPSAEGMPDTEQPGCLHTNMDLYRWAEKLSPWVPTPLLGETLDLAWQARIIDSRAGPYDLRPVGLQPIPVETEEGRQEFVAAQQHILAIATPLRRALITEYERVLHWMDDPRVGSPSGRQSDRDTLCHLGTPHGPPSSRSPSR